MSITNYATLQTAVGRWLTRADLAGVIPDFISLAEARLRRDVRAQNTIKTTIVLASDTVNLPADVQEVRAIRHASASYRFPLSIVSPEQLGFLRQGSAGSTGLPTHASILHTTTGVVADLFKSCDQNYNADLIYFQKLPSLSDGATTNWLITAAPDVYLYASLLEAAPYLKEDERVGIWKGRLDESLAEMKLARERGEFGASRTVELVSVF